MTRPASVGVRLVQVKDTATMAIIQMESRGPSATDRQARGKFVRQEHEMNQHTGNEHDRTSRHS
eukprot:m.1025712 g.1025712  ORF g.1025712 m.1025712 type:complete len:64 (+) comp24106_c1_seq1:2687-2878(+)